MPLAHFTAAELPGTLAVLVFGISIGAAAALRRSDWLTLGIVGFCGLAAVGSVLDHLKGASPALKSGVDVAFLLAGILLLLALVTRNRRADRSGSATADPVS
jgi:hypothetical protein